MKKTEILAPAGSLESFNAAISAGADAIYVGGLKFGARAYANNFDEETLIDSIKRAHLHGVKVYLTTNTLIKNNELYNEYYDFLSPYYEIGLDAVIVQDFGLMSFIHKEFPDIEIHASTQCSLFTHFCANELREMFNITRLVPARELSIEQIRKLRKNTNLEIEVFTHGALCYCYSGKCLMSSLCGGRSGNRGRCAQPCRHLYSYDNSNRKGYYLSTKDLCSINNIDKLIEAGVDSFKIEGRMKKPEYVALCTALYKKYTNLYYDLGSDKYREYIKKHQDEFEKDVISLSDIYNRGGFSDGYFNQHNGNNMMCFDRPNHFGTFAGFVEESSKKSCSIRLAQDIGAHDVLEIRGNSQKNYYEFTTKNCFSKGDLLKTNITPGIIIKKGQQVFRTRNQILLDEINSNTNNIKRIPLRMEFIAKKNDKSVLKAYCDDISVQCSGNEVQKAQSSPVSKDRLISQLTKLGNTEFVCQNINIDCDDDIFIPMGEINELRRNTILKLIKEFEKKYSRDLVKRETRIKQAYLKKEKYSINDIVFHVSINDTKISNQVISLLCNNKMIKFVHFCMSKDKNYNRNILDKLVSNRKVPVIKLPEILTYDNCDIVMECVEDIMNWSEAMYEVNNPDSLVLLKKTGVTEDKIIIGPSVYCFNDYSLEVFENMADYISLPYELAFNEIPTKQACPEKTEVLMTVLGHIPTMVSAQCVKKNTSNCNMSNSSVELSGDNEYLSKCYCDWCYNIVYSKEIINYCSKVNTLLNAGIKSLVLDLTNFDYTSMCYVIDKIENSCVDKISLSKYKMSEGYFDKGVL